MKIQTFKKVYKNEKFISLCEMVLPMAMLPSIKLAQVINGYTLQGYADLWIGATVMSSLVVSSICHIKRQSSNAPYYSGKDNFTGYISHFIDGLFISKNKQIYNNVMSRISELNSNQQTPVTNENLKEAILFSLMKILTACGVDKKDTWWAFSRLNKDKMKYANFFIDEQDNAEKQMCEKISSMPHQLVQAIFDLCIEEMGEDMGARFYLIHQHQTKHFYEVMEKVTLHFSSEDRRAAKEFVKKAQSDEGNSSQYLSYGTLLNEGLIDSLLSQENIPDEILDYLIFSNDNISLDKNLIEKITEIKNTRHEKALLSSAIDEVKPISLKQNAKIIDNFNSSANTNTNSWAEDRMLELPTNLPIKAQIFKV